MMSRRFGFGGLLLAVILVSPLRVGAAVRSWSGGAFGGSQFTDPGSWFDGVPTNNTTSDVGLFYGFFGGPWHTDVVLSTPRSVRGIEFAAPTDGGAAVNFTFSGSKLTVGEYGINTASGAGNGHVINNDVGLATNQTWSLDRNLRINGALEGSGDLFKAGSATLTLAAANTNPGILRVAEGTLAVTGAGRIFDRSDVFVASGATIRFDAMTDAVNGLYSSGTVDLVNNARLVVGNSINDSQGDGVVFGNIQGNGALSKRGPGTLYLSGDNTYTDGTRVESGILLIGNSSLTSATGPGPVIVTAGGSLGGSGTAEGSVTVESGGVLFPGDGVRFSDRTGLLTTIGLTLNAGATLKIDLGGTAPGETHDVLAALNAAIAGSLVVSLVEGFTPSAGDEFPILAATGSLAGNFAGLPQGARAAVFGDIDLTIDYAITAGPDIVFLRAAYASDFDGNGTVNGADLGRWKAGLGTASGATKAQGDANGDGDVDGADWLVWQRQLGSSTPAATTAAVPEPAPGVLILLAAIHGRHARRRRGESRAVSPSSRRAR